MRAYAAVSIRRVKVLVVGSGGREHALAWKLAQSPRLTELHAAPGNPGITGLGPCHPVHAQDAEGLLALARALAIDLVVIGPEVPLVSGVADALRLGGVAVFGPSAAAAQIEGSKRFAKEVMQAAGVSTPEGLAVARPPCVVKADGLAAGKGVFICRTQDELDTALRAVSGIGDDFVVEELLEGDELSVFAICDGVTALGTAARTRLQACVRRRRRPEHRRHGRVLAGPARRARARGARRVGARTGASRARASATRRSSGSSTPA